MCPYEKVLDIIFKRVNKIVHFTEPIHPDQVMLVAEFKTLLNEKELDAQKTQLDATGL